MRTLVRALIGLVVLVVLLLGATWLILPRWIQGSGMAAASQALGRPVSVAQVRFEPWRLGLVLEGLRVDAPEAGKPPQLAIGRVDAALSLRSLWHLAPVVESLRIDNPVLRATRTAEGHYDFDDVLARLSKPKPASASDQPARFALYNLELQGGEVRFDDKPVGRQQVLDRLVLRLPFVSSFPADVKVSVMPSLSGRLNGVAFGTEAQAQPFLKDGESDVQLKLDGLDLAPYLGYLPASLPVRIGKGRLDIDLHVRFVAQRLQLTGRIGLGDFALTLPKGQTGLAWQRLGIELKNVQPLQREVALGAIKLEGAELVLDRDPTGGFGLPVERQADTTAPKPASAPLETKAAAPWQFSLDRFELSGTSVRWNDRSVRPAVVAGINDMTLRIDALRWPLAGTAQLQYSLHLGDGSLQGEGTLAAAQAQVSAQWQGLALAPFVPYVGDALHARIAGLLDGQVSAKLAQPLDDGAVDRIELAVDSLDVRDLAVANAAGASLLQVGRLGLTGGQVLPGQHRVELGAVRIEKPHAELARDAAGHLSIDGLFVATQAAPEARAASPAPQWLVQLGSLALEQGSARWRDAAVGDGAEIEVDQLALQLGALDWPANPHAKPTTARLALRLGSSDASQGRATQRGNLLWQGHLGLAPVTLDGTLRANQLPLQVFSDYLDPAWNLRLRRAEFGLKGRVAASQDPAGWKLRWTGDALLAELRLQQLKDGDGQPLLSWGALNLDGLDVAMAPGNAPKIALTQLRLDDFYARLLVNEQGLLNLNEIGPGGVAVQPGQAASGAAPSPPAASAPAAGATAASGPSIHLSVGATVLSKGKVDFTDHFIKPNYSAELSELEGRLGAFSSDQPAMADVDVRGRVAGTGLLTIGGKVNPATSPPLLDMAAAATDIELAPLSPYAAKYAGYEIERGKLTTKVHYRIDTGGKLQAENQVILNQLEFGQAVDSPDATKLPVRLAVALLKDSHGVIDVNLPISGSINDPEFSVGGIVVRLIVNLLGKALTAPFSLFSGSGTTDLSQLACVPGAPALQDAGQLDTLAKMLQDRPGLTLTITGTADLDKERVAVEARALDAAIQREQRRELRRKELANGKSDTSAADELPPLSAAEHDRLLKVVYDAAKLPNKPRNVIGLAKDIPADQMRALLLPSYAVDAQAVRDLALQRSVGVRDALVAHGIASSRLFLAAPIAAATPASEGDVTAWLPHVELKLGAQ